MDKTMEDKLMYNLNDDTESYPFFKDYFFKTLKIIYIVGYYDRGRIVVNLGC